MRMLYKTHKLQANKGGVLQAVNAAIQSRVQSIPLFYLFWVGFGLVVFLQLFPRLILGENSYITVHDTLDSEFVWRMKMAANGRPIGDNTLNQSVMNGFPSYLYPSQFNVLAWLFLLFSSFTAYVINEFIVHAVAFLGMFLLLKRYVIPEARYKLIVLGVSLCFGLLPFYSIYNLSVAGQPLLLYAFLNLLKKRGKLLDFLIIGIFPFCSSLPLTGIFILTVLGCWLIIETYRSGKLPLPFLAGTCLLGIGYVITEHNLIHTTLFNREFVSHRVDYDAGYRMLNLQDTIRKIYDDFVHGMIHVGSVHKPVVFSAVIAAAILSYYRKNKALTQLYSLLGIALLLACFFGFYQWDGLNELKERVLLLKTFNVSRFFWFQPLVWFLIFAFALKAMVQHTRIGLLITSVLICSQLAFCLKSTTNADNQIFNNWYLLLAKTAGVNRPDNVLTYKEFYSASLFNQVKAHIGKPQEQYRVVSFGLHPSIAQFNGFYTLDGYQNNYPLKYKRQFREVVGPELERNEKWRAYYDGWGSRAYLFPAELESYHGNTKYRNNKVKYLKINTEAFMKMGGAYVISAVEITEAAASGLDLRGVFHHAASPWNIYLYQVH